MYKTNVINLLIKSIMKAIESTFSIDMAENIYKGYTFGETWNGHAKPFFELEVAKEVANNTTMSEDDEYGTFFKEEDKTFVNKYEGEDYPIKPEIIETEEGQKTVYNFGDLGWTWWNEALTNL